MSYPRSGDEEAKAITQKRVERESLGLGNKKIGNYRKLPPTQMMLTKLKPNMNIATATRQVLMYPLQCSFNLN